MTPITKTIREKIWEKIQSNAYRSKLPYPMNWRKYPKIEKYQKEKDAWGEDQNRLNHEFKRDLMDLGNSHCLDDEQTLLLYDYAYDERHSSGESDIFGMYIDLLDIFDKIQQSKKQIDWNGLIEKWTNLKL